MMDEEAKKNFHFKISRIDYGTKDITVEVCK